MELLDFFYRRTAGLSPCGRYRYWLRHEWAHGNGQTVCFVMLNPSTADATQDDPTIRRCMAFAQHWGYNACEVRNLFAYRATRPRLLEQVTNPSGDPAGMDAVLASLAADTVVLAWGARVPFARDTQILALLRAQSPTKPLYCLGLTQAGHPRHPLYVRRTTYLRPYDDLG